MAKTYKMKHKDEDCSERDIDEIYEDIKKHIGKTMAIALYEYEAFKDSGCIGFSLQVCYEVADITKDKERIRVLVKVLRFDVWDFFREKGMQIFLSILKGQIIDANPEVEEALDIVLSFH